MMVGHIKPLYQAALDQIVRFDMIMEAMYIHICMASRYCQKPFEF